MDREPIEVKPSAVSGLSLIVPAVAERDARIVAAIGLPTMAFMARSPTIPTTPTTVSADDKIRQSMHDANVTVDLADKTVARVDRYLMRCDAVLRRLRLFAERCIKR